MKRCDKSSKSFNFLIYKIELCKKKRELIFFPKATEILTLIICSDISEFKFLNSPSFLKTKQKFSYITYRWILLQYYRHVTAPRNTFLVIKPTRCTDFTHLFWHETLHFSDSSSVHHQEFIHCELSNGICLTGV